VGRFPPKVSATSQPGLTKTMVWYVVNARYWWTTWTTNMERAQPTVMLLGGIVSGPGRNQEGLALSSQLKIAATTLEPIQVMPFANVEIKKEDAHPNLTGMRGVPNGWSSVVTTSGASG